MSAVIERTAPKEQFHNPLVVGCGVSLVGKPRSQYPVLLRMILERVAPEPERIMGDMPSIAVPPPSTPLFPEIPADTPAGIGDNFASKPFLRGLTVDNAPRDDPFASERKGKKH